MPEQTKAEKERGSAGRRSRTALAVRTKLPLRLKARGWGTCGECYCYVLTEGDDVKRVERVAEE